MELQFMGVLQCGDVVGFSGFLIDCKNWGLMQKRFVSQFRGNEGLMHNTDIKRSTDHTKICISGRNTSMTPTRKAFTSKSTQQVKALPSKGITK